MLWEVVQFIVLHKEFETTKYYYGRNCIDIWYCDSIKMDYFVPIFAKMLWCHVFLTYLLCGWLKKKKEKLDPIHLNGILEGTQEIISEKKDSDIHLYNKQDNSGIPNPLNKGDNLWLYHPEPFTIINNIGEALADHNITV